MQPTFNQVYQSVNAFLENNHKEKIERAKLKFQREKENEKRFNKKD